MENLNIIIKQLESRFIENRLIGFKEVYYIPQIWNVVEYPKFSEDATKRGQINVEPYDFIITCIKDHILAKSEPGKLDYLHSLELHDNNELNLTQNCIYTMFVRMFTAWDHAGDGQICSGTFLKAICLLPRLKALNVDIIYLLPVFKCSEKYKKGELGSPYAIKNIYKLDPNLHDSLLGQYNETMLEIEFKAFIEACHLLGIRVMLDFAFRTVSRDNDLLLKHPDWFYWIDYKSKDVFKPPFVETEKELSLLNQRSFTHLYTCMGISDYLAKFTYSPPELDEAKWQDLVADYHKTGQNILDLIESRYGITTAPGFSNVINDPQPSWNDVTYLKFYHDTHKQAIVYVKDNQPPYILQDVACLNLYPGEKINWELWDYILGVIPYYQDNFWIDGARIDMGHALPQDLNQEIIAKIKAKNNNFILWSEEFLAENSQAAKDHGFHFISGNLWSIYKEFEQDDFCTKLIKTVVNAAIPVTATLETPDTPRFFFRCNNKRKIALMIMLNCFIPNAIAFINNGMELMETQPMNLGLDNDESGRFVLQKQDPMYGRLAFFDHYCLHWLNNNSEWMWQLLVQAFSLRNRFIDILARRENFISELSHTPNKKIIFLFYQDRKSGANVFFLANKDFQAPSTVNFGQLLPEKFRGDRRLIRYTYTSDGIFDVCKELWENCFLEPGQIVVGSAE